MSNSSGAATAATSSTVSNASAEKLGLKDAQQQFKRFLTTVEGKEVAPFLQWVKQTFTCEKEENEVSLEQDARMKLYEIAEHVRHRVPVSGILPSEQIVWQKEGYDSELSPTNALHVDCFLFDDQVVDSLVDEGTISRNYCTECGSQKTKPLTFISHSLTVRQIEFIFTRLVPLGSKPEGMMVIDIGSRLGPVIYGAHLFSNGKVTVKGIEFNAELCGLQRSILKEFEMEAVEVLECDVRQCGDVLSKADVIVMNNVFSFFVSLAEQADCWRFLYETLKPGCVIIHLPKIDELTKHLDVPFKLKQWLQKIPTANECGLFAGIDEELFEELGEIHMYRVREKDTVTSVDAVEGTVEHPSGDQ